MAQIAMLLNRALGGEATFDQVYYGREAEDRHEPETETTLADIMAELGKAIS